MRRSTEAPLAGVVEAGPPEALEAMGEADTRPASVKLVKLEIICIIDLSFFLLSFCVARLTVTVTICPVKS
jgi:hypothetical protein